MKRTFTLLILISIYFSSLGQNTGTRIYSITFGDPANVSNDTVYLKYFDYVTNTYGTSHKFPNTLLASNFYTTIDPFNGRYFFIKWNSVSDCELIIADLNNNGVFTNTHISLPANEWGPLEYDCFSNDLLFRSFQKNQFTRIDLDSNTIDSINVITTIGGFSWGLTRAYNPINRQYLYCSGNSIIYVDAINGSVIRNDFFNGGISNIVYDHLRNKYFASANSGLVSIDPVTFTITKIGDIANGSSNEMQPVIDARNDIYFYHYAWQHQFLAIDVTTGNVINSFNYPSECNLQEFYGMYDPIIKPDTSEQDTVLYSVYAKSYQWYKDETPIDNETMQRYKPTASGTYKALVTFYDDRKAFSNKIYVATTNINNTPTETTKPIKLYPNPFHDQTTLEFNNPNKEPYTLVLLNIVGQTVRTYNNITSETLIINRNELSSGVYYYKLLNNMGTALEGKLVVE